MRMKDVKLGDKIFVYVEPSMFVTSQVTDKTITATVIATGKIDKEFVGFYLLGWKDKENIPANATPRAKSNEYWDYVHDDSDYTWIKKIGPSWIIAENKATIQIVINGYHCHECNDYCTFSEPNQKNGTFICFKCRS